MKIFLADDHHLFLEGIQAILMKLGSDTEIDCAFNGHDALSKLSEGSYDIALIDLRLPGIDGFELLTELASINCLTPVIMVTASEDPDDIQKALNLGAMGFVPKSSNGQQITETIHLVLGGEIVKPDENKLFNKTFQNKADWASLHHITPRQLNVLRLMRQGLSNQAIADQLHLSVATVKTHIVALFHALETRNRTETIDKARRLGLD